MAEGDAHESSPARHLTPEAEAVAGETGRRAGQPEPPKPKKLNKDEAKK